MRSALRWFWHASGLRTLKLHAKYTITKFEWERLKKSIPAPRGANDRSQLTAVIIPSDPILLIASKGDDAMVNCLIAAIRQASSNARIYIATADSTADEKAKSLGVEAIRILEGNSLSAASARLASLSPTHCFTLGADVLDGSYDPHFSLRLLALTDLTARQGTSCSVVGFSFSKHPYKALSKAYSSVSKNAIFNLRDNVSFERFRSFCSARSELVADVAFLLNPDHGSPHIGQVKDWISQKHDEGQKVLGLNFHPLLLPAVRQDELPVFIESLVASLAELMQKKNASLVLLAHDFRGSSADHHCLSPLYEQLQRALPGRVFNASREFSASGIRSIVGDLDGMLSGRMHLAIASLAMGTPVFAFDYKDKMEGLFMHFGVSGRYIVPVDGIQNKKDFSAALESFVDELDSLRQSIKARLPHVLELSAKNVGNLKKFD